MREGLKKGGAGLKHVIPPGHAELGQTGTARRALSEQLQPRRYKNITGIPPYAHLQLHTHIDNCFPPFHTLSIKLALAFSKVLVKVGAAEQGLWRVSKVLGKGRAATAPASPPFLATSAVRRRAAHPGIRVDFLFEESTEAIDIDAVLHEIESAERKA